MSGIIFWISTTSGHRPLQPQAFHNHAAAGHCSHRLSTRPHAWECGDWDATWYCTECYRKFYNCSYAAVCEMLGFTERVAQKACYADGKKTKNNNSSLTSMSPLPFQWFVICRCSCWRFSSFTSCGRSCSPCPRSAVADPLRGVALSL